MQFSNQEKRVPQYSYLTKAKLVENKPNNHNINRDYEDDQHALASKTSDSS